MTVYFNCKYFPYYARKLLECLLGISPSGRNPCGGSNTYKQKKLNRVMLNGDRNENGIKINRQICTCSTLFCLSLPLFCSTTMPVRLKRQTCLQQCLQQFFFPCSGSLLFFHCRSFSPYWPLAFLNREFTQRRWRRQRERQKKKNSRLRQAKQKICQHLTY